MKEKAKVLVVDDDRRMTRTICDILKIKGYEVTEANSGEEAVEKVKSYAPDCILMDIKMGGINGIETLKLIKELYPDLPIILMSAYVTDEQISEAKQHGACSVLNKPLDIQAVLSFLNILKKEKSILIVDDDLKFSRTLKDILQVRGYNVETETNPDHVLSYLDLEYKLVVLLDLNLGDKDGSDVLKSIRAKYPSKPVIIITGYKEEMTDSITKALQIGARTCLYKPFEIEELIKRIMEIDREKLNAILEEK
ncbi:MAG: response regulator [Syntrophus sp. (in: bacteria)]|nr:response regulator [Syntrophus sp. (in: bacteria)]